MLLLLVTAVSFAGPRQPRKSANPVLVLRGVSIAIPKGFTRLPNDSADQSTADVAFLIDKKSKEGIFVAVPSQPFEELPYLNLLSQAALKVYFPNEPSSYLWQNLRSIDKVSKFELTNFATQGFNKSNLVGLGFRRVVIKDKTVIVGSIFEVAKGKEAQNRVDSGSFTTSMSVCDKEARIIFSITGERYDESNPPCQLIAIP